MPLRESRQMIGDAPTVVGPWARVPAPIRCVDEATIGIRAIEQTANESRAPLSAGDLCFGFGKPKPGLHDGVGVE